MSDVEISAFQPFPAASQGYSSTGTTIRIWYGQSFLDSDGVTQVQGGNGTTGFYIEEDCTIDGDGIIHVPALTIKSTLNADDPNPQSIQCFAQLFSNGVPKAVIFGGSGVPTGWVIPETTPTNYGQLNLYNQATVSANPPLTFWTASQVQEYFTTLGPVTSITVSTNASTAASAAASNSTNISTADSKAVSDSVVISSLTTTSDSKIASNSLNISVADSKAVSDSLTTSTADSKGVSAGTRASVADSKAVSDSLNTSTADSKGTSAGLAASTADSKALSVSTLTSTAASKGDSAGTRASVADSKAVSDSVLTSTAQSGVVSNSVVISSLTSRVSSKGG